MGSSTLSVYLGDAAVGKVGRGDVGEALEAELVEAVDDRCGRALGGHLAHECQVLHQPHRLPLGRLRGAHVAWMDGWMDGWMEGWMDRSMDGSMDGLMRGSTHARARTKREGKYGRGEDATS